MNIFIYLLVLLLIGLVGVALMSLIPVSESVLFLLGYMWGFVLFTFGIVFYDSI